MVEKGRFIKTESENHQDQGPGFINTMNQIKNMLLGMTIILITILIHLFIETPLITDSIALIGIAIVLIGYFFIC